ncbi:Kelch repeat-containing protein [Candidatus Zixiibacteriota bacterium]
MPRFLQSPSRRIRTIMMSVGAVAMILMVGCCTGPDEDPPPPDTELDILEIYNPVTGVWTVGDSMTTPRSTAASAVIDGKLYVVGGTDRAYPGRPVYDVLEVYDPVTDSWTSKAPMLTPRWGAGAAAVDGKLYVMGGAHSKKIFYDTLEIYDPATNAWTTGPSMPIKLFGPAVAVIDGVIYVAGGLEYTPAEEKVDVATVMKFDPALNIWLTTGTMSTGRGQGAAGAIDGLIYVAGGYLGGDTVTGALESTATGNLWITLTSMPTARGEMEAGVIDGKLYVVGGLLGTGGDTAILEIYDPVANTWTTGTSMPTSRAEASSGVINGLFYVVGGYER